LKWWNFELVAAGQAMGPVPPLRSPLFWGLEYEIATAGADQLVATIGQSLDINDASWRGASGAMQILLQGVLTVQPAVRCWLQSRRIRGIAH
jgi:hypothetical protein